MTASDRADIAMLRDALFALLGAISGKPDSIGLWHAMEDARQALAQTPPLPAELLQDAQQLPPPFATLPCAGSVTTSIHVWTSDAMQAYGEACIAADRASLSQTGPHFNCWALREVYFDDNGEPLLHRAPKETT